MNTISLCLAFPPFRYVYVDKRDILTSDLFRSIKIKELFP